MYFLFLSQNNLKLNYLKMKLNMKLFATFGWPFATCCEWRMCWTTLFYKLNKFVFSATFLWRLIRLRLQVCDGIFVDWSSLSFIWFDEEFFCLLRISKDFLSFTIQLSPFCIWCYWYWIYLHISYYIKMPTGLYLKYQ